MNRWLLAMIALVAVFSGCGRQVSVPTPGPAARVDVPGAWSAADLPDLPVDTRWWRQFDDPVLAQLVTEGLDRNQSLKAAAARLDYAAAQARLAGSELYPAISAGGSNNHRRQNFIGFPIPGSDQRQVLSSTASSYGVSLDLSWEIDVWGKIRAGSDAAGQDAAAVEADLQAAVQSLVGQIAKAWFALLEASQQADLAAQTVASYERTAEGVRLRYERGVRPAIDLRLALSNVSAARARLGQAQDLQDAARRQLESLVGRYPSGQLQANSPLPPVPPLPGTGVPSELVSRRPDLVAAERRLAATDARLVQSRRALYPSFRLSTGSGTNSRSIPSLLDPGFFVWNILGNVVQPVFDGGRLRAQVQASDARTREALAVYADAVLHAFLEVETSLTSEKFLREAESELRESVEQSRASLELAEQRYESGLEPIVTVLESQRRTLDSETQLLSVHRRRLDNRVNLHLALGGGF